MKWKTGYLWSVGFLSVLIANNSFAIPDNEKHQLSTAGGVANPSATSALGENPAGLMHNRTTKLQGQGVRGDGSTWGYGGGLFFGNGNTGAGMALQGFNSSGESPGNVLLLNYGLASFVPTGGFAFGFTGTTRLHKKGEVTGTGTGTTWCVDYGMIFNPKSRTRYGLAIFQILNNVDAVGLGMATDIGHVASFVLDGVFTKPSSTLLVKPGLKVHFKGIQFTASFGVRAMGAGWTWFTPGGTAGIGLNVSRGLRLSAYLNHFAKAFVALTMRL